MIDNSEFKILVVDDEIFNVEVVIGLLEDDGYQLEYSTHPLEALKKIYDSDFDLILLDINMPELNGLEVCKRLKNDAMTKEIPIIFLSAFSDAKTITAGFDAGGVDYIVKPFNASELIARVKTHIELRRYIKELRVRQEKLAKIIATDTLTGLDNRLRFLTVIKKEIQQITSEQTRLTLAYIKVDNLPKINLLYGYKNGDIVLQKVANVLKQDIKDKFTLARFFGSDFILLMPDTSMSVAKNIVKKLLKNVRDIESVNSQITCSIGVGEYILKEKQEVFILRIQKLMEEIESRGGNMISGVLTP